MEIFAGLSVGVLMLAAFVVVARTYALWFRTRGRPELLLALYLTFATVLGYPLMIASTQVPVSELWPLHAGGQVSLNVGFACLMLFTLKVFRPGVLWARCLVAMTILPFAGASLTYIVQLTGENPRPATELLGINLFSSVPIAVGYFWTTFESLNYHRQLRLRLRLGLAQVVVTNRVLLWGLMSLGAGVAVLINLAGMVAGTFMSAPIVLVSSVLGIFHASCLFLAFHPPRWYTGWLDGRYAMEGA
jgi:hypothetical protein